MLNGCFTLALFLLLIIALHPSRSLQQSTSAPSEPPHLQCSVLEIGLRELLPTCPSMHRISHLSRTISRLPRPHSRIPLPLIRSTLRSRPTERNIMSAAAAETPKHETQTQTSNASTAATNNPTNESPVDAKADSQGGTPLPLPAPATDGDAIQLDVGSGESVKLDHLGPLVVNQDGTLSRISNWDKMTEIEKKNTLRILGKRNKERTAALKAQGKQPQD